MHPVFILAQITDTHLLADETTPLRGCYPLANLKAVLRQVHHRGPDLLLLTGDLADQGDRAAYQQLQSAIAPFPLPVAWLPGNHDRLDRLQASFQQPQHYGEGRPGRAVDLGYSWRLLLLNSVWPGSSWGEGFLSAASLAWLQAELKAHGARPTAIALHHHPVPVGLDWVDQMQLRNAAELLELLAAFAQVRLVLFGHVHQEFQQQLALQSPMGARRSLWFYGCPATACQVMPAAQAAVAAVAAGVQGSATPTNSPAHLPGFRLFHLYGDGSHASQVHRVDVPFSGWPSFRPNPILTSPSY